MPHAHHAIVGSFWASAALILAALVYLRGWLRVGRLGLDSIAGWRAGSFVLGLLFIWIAMASPLAALDHELLTAHMAQHLLLMTLAAPLIWLGAPVMPFLHGLPRHFVQRLIAPLLRPSMQQLGKTMTHPAVCWLGAAGTLLVWHIPAVFMIGLRSEMWHGIEQASFLATGLLFWWPVVQPWRSMLKWPAPLILLYLFLATLPCDILSGFLVFCDRVVYPVYVSSSQPFGLSALEDQQCAGALMWTCVTVVYLIAGAIFTARLLSPQRSRDYWILQSESGALSHATGRGLEIL
jgi:putative membrane protein